MTNQDKINNYEKPTKIVDENHKRELERYTHPAYGLITMTTPQGGGIHLFGSDITHENRVRIKICRAEGHRELSSDWEREKQVIVDFEMSHAQFAQFITSAGNGSGTPCTLRLAPDETVQAKRMPFIEGVESKGEIFSREIQDSARRQMEELRKKVDALGELINETGTVSKPKLKSIHRDLSIQIGNLPGNMSFVVKSAEEAFCKIASHAKIEVESYSRNLAERLGLGHIIDMGLLTQQKDDEQNDSDRD